MSPQVEFAYNATRALGIEHTPFEANFGFSLEEAPGMVFGMPLSIAASQDTTQRSKSVRELHTLVLTLL
jgi:hypothetical protein